MIKIIKEIMKKYSQLAFEEEKRPKIIIFLQRIRIKESKVKIKRKILYWDIILLLNYFSKRNMWKVRRSVQRRN